MRVGIVWTILRKELLEALRDRRTLVRLILIPALLYPLFALGVSKLIGSETAAMAARTSRVAVWGRVPEGFGQSLAKAERVELLPWAGAPAEVRRGLEEGQLAPPPYPEPTEEDARAEEEEPGKMTPRWTEPDNPVITAARAVVARREVDAVLVSWPSFNAAMEGDRQGPVSVYFDSVRADSMTARNRLERAVVRARKEIRAEREARRGVPEGFSTPIELLFRNVAPESRRVGQLLGAMMPVTLILMSLLGAFLPAIDLTAGEKERGTMQTLLCAPVRPLEIIWGKFLAVWCIALLTALANVVSLAFTMSRLLPDVVLVAPTVFGLTFLLLMPVTFLVSALFLALAVFARDYKDGQNAVMPAYLPLTLLAGVAALPVVELNPWTAFAPVLNVALLIKALFLGEVKTPLIFSTLLSSAIYAGLSLLLAARVFAREQVLLGGPESARAVLGLERRKGGEPSAGFALTVFGVVIVGFFYGSLLLERLSTAAQVALTQYGVFFLPPLLLVLAFGYSARETLGLRPPPWRGMLGALLVGASGAVVAAALIVPLLPPPESLKEELTRMVLLDGAPLPLVLLIMALTPALCEETLFRGLVFSGLRRMGPAVAIGVTAVLFGLAHGSLYRLLPTAFLGLGLGYARYCTGSIAPSILIHALNNGLAVSFLYFQPAWAKGIVEGERLPWTLSAAGIAVYLAGLWLLRASRREAGQPVG